MIAAVTTRRRDVPKAPLLQAAFVVLLLAGGLFVPLTDLGDDSLIYPLCCLILAHGVWSVWSWARVTRNWFDCYSLFLIAATLFNAGQALLEVFGLNPEGLLGRQFSSTILAQTLFLVLLGLAAMHLGALIAAVRSPKRLTNWDSASVADEESTRTSLRAVGWVLLLVSLPFTAIMIKEEIAIVSSAGYFALYQQQAATGLNAGPIVLSTCLIPGAIFLLAGASRSRSQRWMAVAIIAGYAATQFYLGVRHEAAILAVEAAWVWHRLVRPIRPALLIGAAAVMVAVIFPLVGAIRNTSGKDRSTVDFLAQNYATIDNPLVASVSEMGGSMETVAHTLTLVPATRDYEMGVGYAYAISTLFPNLFWKIHPAIVHELPSTWLTWQVDPYTAAQGGGFGFSFIAEAYLNFGYLGVPILLFAGGYALARLVRWADQGVRPDRIAFVATAACFAIFLVRAELAVVLRGVVWYSIAPYFVTVWLTRRRAAQSARHVDPSFVRRPIESSTPLSSIPGSSRLTGSYRNN
ncbi:MAG TPA: O-antigen polysaccharide polymerase Wzy [Planctomycetaceae bacterium]|jgi:oligosaccharide repeat unit polymerase|nr:O-antigen polysaccharide polymerase Wzy [Planctomycetaceae bacterium]